MRRPHPTDPFFLMLGEANPLGPHHRLPCILLPGWVWQWEAWAEDWRAAAVGGGNH